MENTKNEALALLWAYELNRENKQLFKGLKKVNRCLDASRPTTSPSCANGSRQNNGKVNQQTKTQNRTQSSQELSYDLQLQEEVTMIGDHVGDDPMRGLRGKWLRSNFALLRGSFD
ncbi:hypothetical protein N7519_004813 [Penicillium mononematosum]|uniref:uncharacterized protein n=1 Tax=Penicillium mononematosum TaxID=268346 RepID=UPI0025489C5F|nr:uncharacterized protein N7519_004813 [Penicillium mononematosum]KAJ6189905.1 hypothetical protein N7519_004813 [Penicillium mononematosum]